MSLAAELEAAPSMALEMASEEPPVRSPFELVGRPRSSACRVLHTGGNLVDAALERSGGGVNER